MAKSNILSDIIKQFNRITGRTIDENLTDEELKNELEAAEELTTLKLQGDISVLKSQMKALQAETAAEEEAEEEIEEEEETIEEETVEVDSALDRILAKLDTQEAQIKDLSTKLAQKRVGQKVDPKKAAKAGMDVEADNDGDLTAEELKAWNDDIAKNLSKNLSVIQKPWQR